VYFECRLNKNTLLQTDFVNWDLHYEYEAISDDRHFVNLISREKILKIYLTK